MTPTLSTSKFSEAELIEMEHRFRRLEDAFRRADLQLKARESHINGLIAKAEDELSFPGKEESASRRISSHERDLEWLQDVRHAVDSSLRLCKRDLLALVERERAAR